MYDNKKTAIARRKVDNTQRVFVSSHLGIPPSNLVSVARTAQTANEPIRYIYLQVIRLVSMFSLTLKNSFCVAKI